MNRKKRFYDKLIDQGRCARCGKDNPDAASNYCEACRQYMREYQAWLRAKAKRDRADLLAKEKRKRKTPVKRKRKPSRKGVPND